MLDMIADVRLDDRRDDEGEPARPLSPTPANDNYPEPLPGYETDPRWAYMEWLVMEHRLLQHELMGDWEGRYSACNTFAREFHFPDAGWESVPRPSTRAEVVMRSAGVIFPDDHKVDGVTRCAALHFEPWVRGREEPITVRALHQAADRGTFQAVTMAYELLFRTKQQLIDAVGTEEGFKTMQAITENFAENREWLNTIAGVIETAEIRLFSAMATVALRETQAS